VSDVSGAGGKRKRRPAKDGADVRKGAAPATSKGNAKTAATTQPAATPEQRDAAGQPQHADLDWEPTARSSNGSAAASGPDAHQDLEDP